MSPPHSDITATGWVARLPPPWVHYARLARLDRLVGVWLLLLPCWWGVALAGGLAGDLDLYLLFALGAVVMRGAGCTINDLFDRDIDRQVARTRTRPLAAGALSLRQAVGFLAVQLALGALVLIQLPRLAIELGLGIMVVVIIYPLMKRVTWWPQLFLGIAFNIGVLIGFAASSQTLTLPAWLLYFAGICWTLGYDTIYAHQDKEDDMRIGVKSTALRFGAAGRRWIGGFYAGAVILAGMAFALAGAGMGAFALLGLFALLLAVQLARVNFADPAACLSAFRANVPAGWVLFAACVAGST